MATHDCLAPPEWLHTEFTVDSVPQLQTALRRWGEDEQRCPPELADTLFLVTGAHLYYIHQDIRPLQKRQRYLRPQRGAHLLQGCYLRSQGDPLVHQRQGFQVHADRLAYNATQHDVTYATATTQHDVIYATTSTALHPHRRL